MRGIKNREKGEKEVLYSGIVRYSAVPRDVGWEVWKAVRREKRDLCFGERVVPADEGGGTGGGGWAN